MDPDERQVVADWVREQLAVAEVPKEIHGPIWNLLNTWWVYDLSPESTEQALEAFVSLAQNHALKTDKPGEQWVDARPGSISVRDQVRVKADAYPGEAGREHNMRGGYVIGVRRGDIIVRYNDSDSVTGVHHSPHALEKRVR